METIRHFFFDSSPCASFRLKHLGSCTVGESEKLILIDISVLNRFMMFKVVGSLHRYMRVFVSIKKFSAKHISQLSKWSPSALHCAYKCRILTLPQ